MEKKNKILDKIFEGDKLSELPLSLSFLSLPPQGKSEASINYASSSFYRVEKMHCGASFKRISRLIDFSKK